MQDADAKVAAKGYPKHPYVYILGWRANLARRAAFVSDA